MSGSQPGEDAAQTAAAATSRPSAMASAVMTYATNLTVAALSLVNVLIVARVLGPSGRGDVAFLITVVTMTGMLASFSVQEANGNIAGTRPHLRRALATNSLVFSVVFGGIAALVVVAVVAVFPSVGGEVSRALLYGTLASLPLVIMRVYFSVLCQADYAFGITNAAWLSGPVTTFVTNGVLALLGSLTVGTAIGAWIVGQALGVVLLVIYVARHAGFGRPDAGTARQQFGFGSRVHPSRFLGVGQYRADQWFVGAISGSRELGLYSVAVAWAEALFYLPGVLVLIQRPDLVRAEREEAVRDASRMFRVAVILATIMAVGLIVLAPVLCVTVFGDEFGGAVEMLRILAFAAPGIVAYELLSSALIAQRKPLHASAAVAVAFLLTVILNPLLIPTGGGMGAAVARSLAYGLGGAAVALIFTRVLRGRLGDLAPRGNELSWFVGKVKGRFSGG